VSFIKRHFQPFMTVDLSTIVDDLATFGWSVAPAFVDGPALNALIQAETELWEAGQFRPARIGASAQQALRPEIRSDRIHWLDASELPPAVEPYWQRMEALRLELNQSLYLGVHEFEAHFAVYPPGASYERHLDQFKGAPHRIVSCILYLNPDWRMDQGGSLRLYPPDAPEGRFLEIPPEGGTFVCFLSDRIVHEVLPANRERFSLTGWLRRRNG
jgi:SM-20-related protein